MTSASPQLSTAVFLDLENGPVPSDVRVLHILIALQLQDRTSHQLGDLLGGWLDEAASTCPASTAC